MKSEWITQRLSEIVDFNPRESLPKGGLAKKIPMDALQPYCRDIPTYEVTEFNGGTKFRNGDTIMARITPCLENGKTAQVNILGNDEIGFGSTEFIVFRAKKGISDPDYIYYLVSSPLVRDPSIKSMVGSSGRQRVQTDVVQGLQVPVPPLEEQRKIAGILRTLDDKIKLNTEINKNLEAQIDSLYTELFIRSANPKWKLGTVADLGTVIGGSTPSKKVDAYYTDHGIAWITPKDLSLDRSKFFYHGETDITNLGLSNSSATIMPPGTVLFSSRAPIGYIAIAANELCTNQGFKSVVPKKTIGTAFVYCFLKANLPTIENMASGSTFKEVSGSIMKSVPATIPDQESISHFNDFAKPRILEQKNLEAENRSLATIRDSLLPRLMSGELDISKIALSC